MKTIVHIELSDEPCNICGAELSTDPESLQYDCGGDCLWCMAKAGDPDCQARVLGFFIGDCLTELKEVVNQYVTLAEEAGSSGYAFRERILEQFRPW